MKNLILKALRPALLAVMMLVPGILSAQTMTVTGVVSDSMGPLPGAAVMIVGSGSGTITDMDGNFSLKAKEGDVLRVENLGYKSFETVINADKSHISVLLESDSIMLEEAVMIGYGSVKKSDLTGSVASIKTEQLENITSPTIEGVLQGRAAGLQVISSSQDPGAGSVLRIRGNSSLNGSNAPLIVLDGFPLGDAGNLSLVSASDIESIEILKDASASAIYGSRGANGVILIKTKSSKGGITRVEVKHQTTISQLSDKLNIWHNPLQMAQIANEELINAGLSPLYSGQYNNGVYYPSLLEIEDGKWSNTDWASLCLRTPMINNTSASVSTSSDKGSLNLSFNYYDEQGLFKQDSYNKGNLNLNATYKLWKKVTLQFNSIAWMSGRNVNNGLEYGRNPLWPVYNADGTYYIVSGTDFSHPLVISENVLNKTKGKEFVNSLSANWEIIEGLKLTTQLNYKFNHSLTDVYYASNTSQNAHDLHGEAHQNYAIAQDILTETYLTWDKTFQDKHHVSLMAGHSFDKEYSRGLNTTAYGFVNDKIQNEDMSAGDPSKNVIGNYYTTSSLLSFYGRANYTYDDRFLFTLTMRADGSSKFGDNSKWGYFPSGAVSWKMHNEDFIRNLGVFNELKLRASYGLSGNQGISAYQTLNRYGKEKFWYQGKWANVVGPGYEVGREGANDRYILWGGIANPDLRWETTSQADFGLDMAFFDRRLTLTLDGYYKYTSDLLRERYLPLSSGYDKMWVNDGNIMNTGFEAVLEGVLVSTRDISFTSTLIFSLNRNKVVSLGDNVSSGLSTDPLSGMKFEYCGPSLDQFNANPCVYAVGMPMYMFYGYKVAGIIQPGEDPGFASTDGKDQPGEFKYVDLNGDYAIDEKDRCIIGNPNPDFTMSLNLSFKWKNLDASMFLNGVFGGDVIYNGYTSDPRVKVKRWSVDNPTNLYPSLNSSRSYLFSDYFVQDGSFVRIQNLSVGYTIPFNLKVIHAMRIFGSVENLYTFTKFDGYDPEVGVDGIYWGGYPKFRKYNFGLSLQF